MNVRRGEVTIRDELEPGDLGYAMYLHGLYYRPRLGYGPGFELTREKDSTIFGKPLQEQRYELTLG